MSQGGSSEAPVGRGIGREPFGELEGATVELFTLTNAAGQQARITSYGGILVSLCVPDRDGALADVVLGCDDLASYVADRFYFGALIGRYANRIAGGRFVLDGRRHELSRNSGGQHLHGGLRGYDKALWQARPELTAQGPQLVLSHVSAAGDEGYPGTLSVEVAYLLDDRGELALRYQATTDAPTPVNLTQHAYFNLAGAGRGDVLGHLLTLHAERFAVVGEHQIPTGELRPVSGTPMDFRTPTAIGARIDTDDEQLRLGQGYDHCWVLRDAPGPLVLAARAVEPRSGRVLEVLTTEPALQLYSGNGLHEAPPGKRGLICGRHGGFCLETQHLPDSPNQPRFPSTILAPGQTLQSTTIYRFATA